MKLFAPHARGWPLIIGVWIGVSALIHWVHTLQPSAALTQSEFASATPEQWQAVTLPHDWYPANKQTTNGWYRLQFQYPGGATEPWAILLWQVSMNAAVTLNGQRIGDGGSMADPLIRNWFRPLMFVAPVSLLRPGANELLIQIRTTAPDSGFLGPVYAGPLDQLRPWFDARYFLKVTLLYLLVVLFLTMSLPTVLLWLKRKEEKTYLWHAISAVLSAIYLFNIVAAHPPVSAPVWIWLHYSNVLCVMIAIMVMLHRYLGIVRPRFERILWALAAVIALVIAVAGSFDAALIPVLGARVSDGLLMSVSAYTGVLMFKVYTGKPDHPGFWLMPTGILLMLLGLRDIFMLNHLIAPFNGFYLPYAAPGPLIAFTGILLERFLRLLRESENLTVELAQRVEQKTAELRHSYDEQKVLEQSRLIAEERSRILMDMHDGIGGHLVSTLARLEKSGPVAADVASSVRDALADLRLIIYSLEPSAQSLRTALATMRDRLEGAFEDSGVSMRWRLDELPESLALGPRNTLQLLRFVQEAITNVFKHAGASRLEFRAGLQAQGELPGLNVEISDNGRGFDQTAASSGKGLNNLRRRARHLNGRLVILQDNPGVRIQLWIPLPP